LTSFPSKTGLIAELSRKSAIVYWFIFLLKYVHRSLLCFWINRIVNNWASWSKRPFLMGMISNLFKYELSIKTLSIVESEFGPIQVRKFTMLLRLNDCKILLSWFFISHRKVININASPYNKIKFKIKKFAQNKIKIG
jgi:hypothetical protein